MQEEYIYVSHLVSSFHRYELAKSMFLVQAVLSGVDIAATLSINALSCGPPKESQL